MRTLGVLAAHSREGEGDAGFIVAQSGEGGAQTMKGQRTGNDSTTKLELVKVCRPSFHVTEAGLLLQ